MADGTPPQDHDGLIRLIHARHDQMSKTYQKIALYLTQNPNEIAVLSINALARTCGVHASSFVRFAQALGYSGFKEVQALYQRRLATAPSGFAGQNPVPDTDHDTLGGPSEGTLFRTLIQHDIAALHAMIAAIPSEDLTQAADLMSTADVIYLVGQSPCRPVIDMMRRVLTERGKRCISLDLGGGLATRSVQTMGAGDLLFVMGWSPLAPEVVRLASDSAAAGHRVIAVSDSTLGPLATSASVFLAVPPQDAGAGRSLTAPMSLARALVMAAADPMP